jgi:hypothetical protein
MFAKTTIAVSVAIVLGAASSATAASDREIGGGFQVQTWQGIQGLNHSSYVTGAGHAYALDESSNPKKKKVSKQESNPAAGTVGQGKLSKPDKQSKTETEEQARQRRYYENR